MTQRTRAIQTNLYWKVQFAGLWWQVKTAVELQNRCSINVVNLATPRIFALDLCMIFYSSLFLFWYFHTYVLFILDSALAAKHIISKILGSMVQGFASGNELVSMGAFTRLNLGKIKCLWCSKEHINVNFQPESQFYN